jgi:branched-chain amino acid transport system permease protein
MLADIFSMAYQAADVFAFLILSAAGLAIIFGMMGVINMAHGELIMCGAYITVAMVHRGVPLPMAQACATIVAGMIGVLLECTIIRKLYKRPVDSLLATWGLSLIVTQAMLLLFGSSLTGIGTPAGEFQIGNYTFASYRLILIAAALVVLAVIYVVFMCTRFGVHARATMQNAAIAQATGVRVGRVYALCFGFGAALAGLCGALYAPTMTLVPTMGTNFIVESFVTVVVGGANVLLGTAPAGIVLATIRSSLNAWGGQIVGQIGMLLAVIIVIRMVPDGFSGWLRRWTR